jgi:hypothetical protein
VKLVLLDRGLAHYGPETKPIRDALAATVTRIIAQLSPAETGQSSQLDPTTASAEGIYDQIQALVPKTDAQRTLQNQMLNVAVDMGHLRWLLFQQSGSAISPPFLIVLVFWLSVIFAGFGLMAPANPTTTLTLMLCALSVAGAIFLILELDRPFDGLIRISSAPLQTALAQLGR